MPRRLEGERQRQCHSPHPQLLQFSRREGNIEAVQRVLYVPTAKNAGALMIGFCKILQHQEVAFSSRARVFVGVHRAARCQSLGQPNPLSSLSTCLTTFHPSPSHLITPLGR